MIEKMKLESQDVAAQKRAELKQLFPSVFTETENDQGQLVESIDFEKLKAELGTFSDVFESRRQRYNFTWPGKRDALQLIQRRSIGTLVPHRDKSVDFDTTKHLYIEGDNLEVLKLLQKPFYGRVKMIYIDPPYNTGKDFIYPDDYSETLDTYLAFAGLADAEGKKFDSHPVNEGRLHTRWLNMMYPRLFLARNLLSDDGLLLISINDNEVANLKKVCDEIMGEGNFVTHLIWNSEGNTDNQLQVKVNHEYILLYSKDRSQLDEAVGHILDPNTRDDSNLHRGFADNNITKNNPRNPPQRVLLPAGFECSEETLELPAESVDETFFAKVEAAKMVTDDIKAEYSISNLPVRLSPMTVADGKLKVECEIYSGYANLDKLKAFIANRLQPLDDGDGQIRFYINRNGCVRYNKTRPRARNILSVLRNVGTTEKNRTRLKNMGIEFDYPKPIELLRYLIAIACDKEGIVLDFFAGSGTTAHALLEQCLADGVARRFIVVQLPESTRDEGDVAELGRNRVHKAIDELKARSVDATEQPLFDANRADQFSDLGFRFFSLDRSNFLEWRGTTPDASVEALERQLELHVDHLDTGHPIEAVLFEILLKAGCDLSQRIEERVLAGKRAYSIEDDSLVICLEDSVSQDFLDAVVELEPMQFICLDRAFAGNDQLKANAVQTFAARNQGREKADQIVFRTV